jgi:hypothetical protein
MINVLYDLVIFSSFFLINAMVSAIFDCFLLQNLSFILYNTFLRQGKELIPHYRQNNVKPNTKSANWSHSLSC